MILLTFSDRLGRRAPVADVLPGEADFNIVRGIDPYIPTLAGSFTKISRIATHLKQLGTFPLSGRDKTRPGGRLGRGEQHV